MGIINSFNPTVHSGLDISRGLVDGQSNGNKFGRNTSVGTTEEVIWDHGGNYPFLLAPITLDISSSSADDENPGTGAWNLVLTGLDGDLNPKVQTINLLGKVKFETEEFYRLHRMYARQDGTGLAVGGANVGTITAVNHGGANVLAKILPTIGQTQMCVYTVPAGYTMYVTQIFSNCMKRDDVIVMFKYRNALVNGAFSAKQVTGRYQNGGAEMFACPFSVPEKTDVVMTAVAATSGQDVNARWEYILVAN